MYNDEEQVQPTNPETPETPITEAQAEPKTEQPNTSSTPEPEDLMAQAMSGNSSDGSFRKLSRGQIVEGTVVHMDKDSVMVDVGTKSEGIIHLNELSSQEIESTEGIVNVGDKINVYVMENSSDGLVLSKKRADFEDAWDLIEGALREGMVLTAMVTERVKGGLVVDVGVRGFVPATHVGNGKLRNIDRYVGQSIPLKVLEIDRERRKVVLSNKTAEDERRETLKVEVFSKLEPGQILDGVVRRLVDYGAFVDLGGVDGLLHISEMSWTRISHPTEMFQDGDKIKVKILKVDEDSGKISLGHRQVLPDPWSLVSGQYKVGDVVQLPVSRLVQNGAFLRLPEGVEGFVPISELAPRRIGKPSEVVSEGQVVDAQIIELRTDERKMLLSLRALVKETERRDVERHPSNRQQQQHQQQQSGGATIGERLSGLSALKDLMKDEAKETKSDSEPSEVKAKAEAPVEPVADVVEVTAEPVVEATAEPVVETAAQEETGKSAE